MLNLIHTADIMLDAPMKFRDSEKARARREEIRRTFTKLLDFADERLADLLLISGNLFDKRNITKATYDFLKSSFASHPDLRVFIMPGRLDPCYPDSAYIYSDLGDNVFAFTEDELTGFEFTAKDGGKVTVYGSRAPFAAGVSVLDKLRCDGNDGINVLMWGGDPADGTEGSGVHDLALTGVDYVALGECSLTPGVNCEDQTWYAYPGALEPVSFDQPGKNGVICFECYKESGDLICKYKHVGMNERSFIKVSADVTGCTAEEQVISKIESCLDANGDIKIENNIVRITLTGDVSPDTEISESVIANALCSRGAFDLVVEDETAPLYNFEYLSGNPTIKGAYFNACRELLNSSEKGERERTKSALRIGLAALNGKKLGDLIDDQ